MKLYMHTILCHTGAILNDYSNKSRKQIVEETYDTWYETSRPDMNQSEEACIQDYLSKDDNMWIYDINDTIIIEPIGDMINTCEELIRLSIHAQED